ncbi:hypothetical protein [uncultured Paracoccus sp.]|uniref:hypothetical protein n=1 Tax=uncultured Paracoccus sp. TaxID=189685 RepID=UPI0030DB5D54
MPLSITKADTGRGLNFAVRMDGQVSGVHIDANLPKGAERHLTPIEAVLTSLGEVADDLNRDLTPVGLQDRLRKECQRLVPPVKGMIEAGIDAEQTLAATYDRLDALPEAGPFETLTVEQFAKMNLAGKAGFTQSANRLQLAAVLRAGRDIAAPEIDPAIWTGLVARYRRLSLINSYGLQSKFAGSSSLNDPFAPAKPDQGAAEQAASEMMKSVAADAEKINNLKRLIQNLSFAVGIMCGVSADSAFHFLTGEAAL